MVTVDNNFLSLMLHPEARPPLDPTTQLPLTDVRKRFDHLIKELSAGGEVILIPTPALAEFFILAKDDGPAYLAEMERNRLMQIRPFDTKAAAEYASMHRAVLRSGGGRRGNASGTWAKITFDRQIVAIAKSNGAHTMYSDDGGVTNCSQQNGLAVVHSWELPLPPEDPQQSLFVESELVAAKSREVESNEGGKDDQEAAGE